jgi:NAD(P)-dependent dehydrogenase (short-subunit alcohol dehydrogenase family)
MALSRVVLVIGGTGGLGGAVARALANDAAVTVTGATQGEVDAALADPAFAGMRALPLDVRDDQQVRELVSGFEALDVLVNAAGIAAAPADFTVEGFERTIDINLLGTVRTSYAARPLLEASEGCIINFGSMMSYRGSGTGPAYAASKGGILLLTSSLAAAWGPRIRVNAIAPGFMDTPLTRNIQEDVARSERILSRVPAARWGDPDDLISAARFLADPSSRFVSGVTLPVDGGYLTT